MPSKSVLMDDGVDPDVDDNEYDAMMIEEWLESRDADPLVPMSCRQMEYEWAHDNPDAWPLVELPDDVTVEEAKALMVAALGEDPNAGDDGEDDGERANPYKDKKGKFTFKPVPTIPAGAHPPARPIKRSEFSNPDTPRTRKVTNAEFQTLAGKGRTTLAGMRSRAKPATHVTDARRFGKIKDRAWNDSREPWGGATVNPRTGAFLNGDEDLYALTIKPPGVESVRIPASATRAEFDEAMDAAAARFGEQLTYEGSHLGVFHDDDLGTIDIDPVTVVSSHDDVEQIGAYTNAVGGAYRFSDGNGYWPPYVED